MIDFQTEIIAGAQGRAAVVVPPDVVERLGGGKQIRVRATFDGAPYSGSLVRRSEAFHLGVLKAIREEIGKDVGDRVDVTLKADNSVRKVVIPDELAVRFESHPGAEAAFADLSYSHQREHVNYITDAKRSETRKRRAQLTVERLLSW
jgi:hypothetical protein